MTEDVTTADAPKLPPAPPGHYYTSIMGRAILVKEINTAQSMILGKIYRQMNKDVDAAANLAYYGQVGAMLDSLIVKPEDRQFLEDGMVEGKIDMADFALVFIAQTERAPDTGPKKPRRGRQ